MIKIFEMGKIRDEEIFARFEPTSSVEDSVKGIIARVRAEGDAALRAYSAEFDHVDLEDFLVSTAEIEAALAKVEPGFIAVLEEAAANIRAFHSKQVRNSFILADKPGVILGQRVIPLEKVGLYVPGGTAAYPSTVLMDAIPAKIAGVEEIVMVTPPNKEGSVNPYILAAAHVAGVGRIFKVGGAQAVAALAYGTASIPRVDKIVGPGNAFVAEAKKQVFGQVGIDMIAGPSEVLVLADGKSDPRFVAADLLSQAEHDKNASAVLITDSMALAEAVQQELEVQLAQLKREEIARASIDHNGKIIVAHDLREGIDAANRIAPEHMEVCVDQPFDYLPLIKNAGSVFLGRYNAEPTGDYFAGPNHTLPTSGTLLQPARCRRLREEDAVQLLHEGRPRTGLR